MRKKCSLLILFSLILFFFAYSSKYPDARFEKYTHSLFCQEVCSDSITLHYTLKSPAAYNIYTDPLSFGHVTTDSAAAGACAENALAKLHSHNRSRLSDENQLIYDLLEASFTTSQKLSPFTLYEEPLSPLTGTQAQLPILLSEYQFYSEKDVKIYLDLLKQLPSYFQAIADFETAKSKKGLFMSSQNAASIIEECEMFISAGDSHYLYSTFSKRLSALELPEDKVCKYEKQNQECLETHVFPAYQILIDRLSPLLHTGKNEGGLCHLPDGKDYYSLLVTALTGSSRSISELKQLTRLQIQQDLSDLQTLLFKVSDSGNMGFADTSLTDTNPSSILNTLSKKIEKDFPSPPAVSIRVKYVDSAMEKYLSPAFYLIPAIDATKENVIYINPAHLSDDLSLFTTLAHEGYPGHLYQTTYFSNTNPHPLRSLLGSGGYTEGWATYCEMLSYDYAPLGNSSAAFLQKNASATLGLYALADMGIHYDGWSLSDTFQFFREYGIYDETAIQEIYYLIVGDPGNYLKYYIGYVEFLELKKATMEKWGDEFTLKKFHEMILDTGPVPFDILYEKLIGDFNRGRGFFQKTPSPIEITLSLLYNYHNYNKGDFL